MRKTLIVLTLFVTSAIPAFGSPKHWYTDKKWWVGEAVIVTAVALDMNSTAGAIHRGGWETNVFLCPHPSTRRIAIMGTAAGGYWTFFHALDWHFFHDDSKGFRIFSYTAIPAIAVATHVPAAINNYSVNETPAAVREGLVKP